MSGPDAVEPRLRIVRGNPSPEEVAVLVAVLTARARALGAAATPGPPTGFTAWRASALPPRPVRAARAGWRRSGLPR